MPFKDIIKGTLLPTIPIKELWTADTSQASSQNPYVVAPKSSRSSANKTGVDFPYVKINSVPINEIDKMILDETGMIPKIKLIFTDSTGALAGPNYPKKDPVLSLYIKTQNEKFKPIRCDFLITGIKNNSSATFNSGAPDTSVQYTVTGELYVPTIYNNVSRSYRNMTSKEALTRVAEENGLGFAENDFNTVDSMTWINTNDTGLNFIRHVSRHAYRDDDSFFNSFIDKYYYLNFLSVTEQLEPTTEFNNTYENTVGGGDLEGTEFAKDRQQKEEDLLNILKLTNKESYRGRPDYVINYSLTGDVGRILKSKGYRKKIYYYDHIRQEDQDKFTSFFVNPIKIKGYSEDRFLDPDDVVFRENLTKKWMNINYGNTHREWNGAVLINDHNNTELNKLKLKVETAGINFQVIRGIGIPVILYQPIAANATRDAFRQGSNQTSEPDYQVDPYTLIADDILSGRYFVNGVKYIYDSMDKNYPFKTQFELSKFNWDGENLV
jgi:hypothetical protein